MPARQGGSSYRRDDEVTLGWLRGTACKQLQACFESRRVQDAMAICFCLAPSADWTRQLWLHTLCPPTEDAILVELMAARQLDTRLRLAHGTQADDACRSVRDGFHREHELQDIPPPDRGFLGNSLFGRSPWCCQLQDPAALQHDQDYV
eukprot:CAMPEP_0203907936 /NCGR_PEP_ID=MMETSP0359-20131031/49383_1 /ASSEMBLY_ACC=CAM_ASM_000338 /TAXON_ID=268821 /ORGANISM="Scrippsiella Hangoei, Strain SHTV-5" /LENGTH=148 /DNA_ID=CAMNT_0050832839 /DNA_START=177 /DNA_END=623 /DNA_ORIENTATION=+